MSDWKKLIQPGPVWSGVDRYADERIAELTAVCIDAQSTTEMIRQAQAGIEEMRRLQSLPDRLTAEKQVKDNSANRRQGY